MLVFSFCFCTFNVLANTFHILFNSKFVTNLSNLFFAELIFMNDFQVNEPLFDIVFGLKNEVAILFECLFKFLRCRFQLMCA